MFRTLNDGERHRKKCIRGWNRPRPLYWCYGDECLSRYTTEDARPAAKNDVYFYTSAAKQQNSIHILSWYQLARLRKFVFRAIYTSTISNPSTSNTKNENSKVCKLLLQTKTTRQSFLAHHNPCTTQFFEWSPPIGHSQTQISSSEFPNHQWVMMLLIGGRHIEVAYFMVYCIFQCFVWTSKVWLWWCHWSEWHPWHGWLTQQGSSFNLEEMNPRVSTLREIPQCNPPFWFVRAIFQFVRPLLKTF